MPLENDNMELRRQQQEERWNIMRAGRSYLSPDEQEQQLWDKRAYAERLQEVRDIIRDGWPAEGPVPRGGRADGTRANYLFRTQDSQKGKKEPSQPDEEV